jgi:hypothetical protein
MPIRAIVTDGAASDCNKAAKLIECIEFPDFYGNDVKRKETLPFPLAGEGRGGA